MQWWLIVVIAICAFPATIVVSLVLDVYLRRDLEQAQEAVKMVPLPKISYGPTSNNTLIVYLPGILASADMISPRVLNKWTERGEVWGANYTLPRFMPDRIAREVSTWILNRCEQDTSVHNVVFIGSSMGGLLANDVLQLLRQHEHRHRIVSKKLLLVDAPTERKDLQRQLYLTAPLMRLLPFGPLWNHLSGPIMKLLFIPPKKGEIDSDVDLKWLTQQVEAACSFPLSFWRDQIMYIIDHGALEANSIDCPVLYIRSTKDDDTVSESAISSWFQAAAGRRELLMAYGAKHVAYAQNPSKYEEVFPQAFKVLEL